ncbi:lantibiotic dehydratase family protein [Jidongwangia harbinensis]|uniref:lantibiotic dehydratase family protein n=1 Tax=Jidongwangia harbinensis TaxID=2878561 RepID=UPI001CD9B49C|nr:lantibiotic dehydratase family protein [Jidongwangia harbinensis]MCA2215056.1 lantibiotic dehydratase family protein [Jidongwangia harbinensis]
MTIFLPVDHPAASRAAARTDGLPAAPRTGGLALLRVAGLPIRHWLAGASPDLFALLRELRRARAGYAGLGGTLAERIGTELVPDPRLTAAQRRWALALRRKLHNGTPATPGECVRLAEVARSVEAGGALADRLTEVAGLGHRIGDLEVRAEQLLADERERLLALPWRLLTEDPVGRRAIADGVLAPAEDIRRRLARGEPWTTKRMRRRSAYLWRMIARGTVKTTPRTWLCQVALAPVRDGGPPHLVLPELADRFAVERVENVAVPRRELALGAELTADTGVAVTPLRRVERDHLRLWTVDPANVNRLRSITVRRTGPLTAITEALHGGVRTVGDVTASLLGPDAAAEDTEKVRGLLGVLAMMGVIEPCTPPRRRRTGWRAVTGTAASVGAAAPVGAGVEEYVDVYRVADGAVPGPGVRAVEGAVRQVLRIVELACADRPAGRSPVLDRLDAAPRPVLDLLGDRLSEAAAGDGTTPVRHAGRPSHPSSGWQPPRTPGSGYDRLVRWIDDHAAAGPGGPVLRLTPGLLDGLGAPPVDLDWPVDCVVRPTASGRQAVLDIIRPAGVLDARFTQAIEALHGPQAHVAAYRSFLDELDRRTGVTSVELMVPPLWHVAANAVRRPRYTGVWTGDPDLAAYCEPAPDDPPRFLPLTELTARRDGDSVVLEHHGRPVRLLYHSMRSPLWPWNLLMELIRHDPATRLLSQARMRLPLLALPHRGFLPRMTVGDLLVLSPAQWRLPAAEFWSPDAATDLAKLTALTRLREEFRLPRWVAVYSRGPYSKPYVCDLESLAAVEVVERALNPVTGPADRPFDVFVEEMLPAPGEVPVADRAGRTGERSAAEVMLRLPLATTPAELAARAAVAARTAPKLR